VIPTAPTAAIWAHAATGRVVDVDVARYGLPS
jgi:hypothetical protein